MVTRVGDETIGEMWSLWDGKSLLNEIDPRFGDNIERHIHEAVRRDPFHVSANTDPKGDRSKRPQEQDPDMLVHVVRETDAGTRHPRSEVRDRRRVRRAGVPEAHHRELGGRQAVGLRGRVHRAHERARGEAHLPDRVRGAGALRGTIRSRTASTRWTPSWCSTTSSSPGRDVLFYRHTRAATFIRATLHRYSAFAYVQRILTCADMMIGAALWNVKQTGLERQPAVQEKLAELAVYREGINAHLTAAVAAAEESPSGLLMPNQSLLFTGRVHACANLPAMMHLARELCGGQICITPDTGMFEHPDTGPWLAKFYTINERWQAEDRRKLLAFARDLLNSDYAGHRLTFQLFAQSPPFAHLAAVYRNFDWDGPLDFVRRSAGLSDRVTGEGGSPGG